MGSNKSDPWPTYVQTLGVSAVLSELGGSGIIMEGRGMGRKEWEREGGERTRRLNAIEKS